MDFIIHHIEKAERLKFNSNQADEWDFEHLPSYITVALTFAKDILAKRETFVFHTSGSTGKPKPIEISLKQIELSAKRTLDFINLEANFTSWLCLKAEFIGGAMVLARAIFANQNVLISKPMAFPHLGLLEADKIDLVSFAPNQFENFAKEKLDRVQDIACVLIGGADMSASCEKLATQMSNKIFHTYGMTETCSNVAMKQLSPRQEKYFQALEGITFFETKKKTLLIKDDSNALSHQTNDVVELIDETHFKFMGRADWAINKNGIKIHPQELEAKFRNALEEASIFINFFIAEHKAKKNESEIVMLIEGSYLSCFSNILAVNDSLLTKHEKIEQFYLFHSLVYTSNGKLDRKASMNLLNK